MRNRPAQRHEGTALRQRFVRCWVFVCGFAGFALFRTAVAGSADPRTVAMA